jgi:hypothetical protein
MGERGGWFRVLIFLRGGGQEEEREKTLRRSPCRHKKKSTRFVPSEELFLDTPTVPKARRSQRRFGGVFFRDRPTCFSGDDGRASFFRKAREREKRKSERVIGGEKEVFLNSRIARRLLR